MEGLFCQHCHHLPVEEVAQIIETDVARGLSAFDVKHRLERFGPNVVTVKKRTGPLKCFLLQFHNPLIYILLASSFVTLILKEWVDASVIFGVVLVNAIIGFIQESKAEGAIESLKKMVTTEALVTRDGSRVRIPSAEIVPGDIVTLQAGDKVPADLRISASRDLKIDESALTGESVPSGKHAQVLPTETVLADRKNMAYAGTLVTYGTATGIVIGTGNSTETGRIAHLISEAPSLQTPLTKKMASFSKLLLVVILGLAAITFVVGVLRSQPPVDMFMAAVALAVGAIPEGLPAAVTITLAIGVARMAKRRAIIRKLPAVETLGSTTVICSDKTGTLTENQMTVKSVMAGDDEFEVTGGGYRPEGDILWNGKRAVIERGSPLVECLVAGLVCNDSHILEKDGLITVAGDPTEGALLVSAEKGGLKLDAVNKDLPRIDSIPFASDKQFMVTLHGSGEKNVAYLKGSLESILKRSSERLISGGKRAHLDTKNIIRKAEEMASKGLRVLAFARIELEAVKKTIEDVDVETGLTFIGLQAMIDPPRDEAIRAVRACHSAGIKVKMITGDHAITAATISSQLGLSGEGSVPRVMTGSELSEVPDEELTRLVEKVDVYARVAPEQKLKLVDALQARGHVVAMTGDGVNDAPALKQADIGIAMGKGGTDVAKEAADMVLTDDNFASIEAAVEEGRGVFDNLTKFIVWTLPTNIGEGLVILAAIFAGVVLPILPVQILWINMTTAVCLGLMLAFEPKEPGIMGRAPRDPKKPIITRTLFSRILLVGALLLLASFGLFEWEQRRGLSVEEARTVAVNVFVFMELFYLFNCRSLERSVFKIGFFSNWWVALGVTIMVLLQLLYTYLPAMNRFFHSRPIDLQSWIGIICSGIILSIVIGMEKMIRRKWSGT